MSTGFFHTSFVVVAALVLGTPSAAFAQEPAAARDQQAVGRRTTGTVTSIGKGSMVVRTDQGHYVVYTVDRDTLKKQSPPVGARVSVVTFSDEKEPAPVAEQITVLPPAQGLAAGATEEQQPDPVPPSVRSLESQIERQAKKYRLGAQVGAALDPELISLDVFGMLGPFLGGNANFRPGLEFAFGEVTTLFGIHLDGIYTLRGISRTSRWAPYVGAGPSFSFSHRGFEDVQDGKRFDFGEFEWHNGMNFIVGAKTSNGAMFEMKATAWGAANIRLLGGFEF